MNSIENEHTHTYNKPISCVASITYVYGNIFTSIAYGYLTITQSKAKQSNRFIAKKRLNIILFYQEFTMANLIIFYRMTLSVSISHPCIPRRKSKSFGYSYMHGCYRMVHHHISSLLFSNNYLALLVSHATFSPKWFQMRSSFRSNQPIWCTPCWYIIDGEFGAPYVLTHMDCIFGLCNAECLTEDTQADVCWVCIKTTKKNQKEIKTTVSHSIWFGIRIGYDLKAEW